MITRRQALGLLGSLSAAPLVLSRGQLAASLTLNGSSHQGSQGGQTPKLAPGAPASPERRALVDAFRTRSEGIQSAFVARELKSDWTMPYRLFAPKANGRVPLVVYLHGSGGLGIDNEKQMGLGNIFGTRLWAMAENQKSFPCYVLVPQTDRGWVKYGDPAPGETRASVVPGLGDGARVAFELIDALLKDLPIDPARIYLTGQSMGGAGVWHMVAQRPRYFAAAAVCCGSELIGTDSSLTQTPIWAFHGDADATVPVSVSRKMIAAIRKDGGHPLYTEYAGVGHNVWEWAYTEPALVPWMFAQRRAG